MVLTREELVSSLNHEVRVLLHLASKIDRTMLNYRPSPRQRSTIELLRYLTVMGPSLVRSAKLGRFDVESWQAEAQAAEARDFDQTLTAIAAHKDVYAREIASMTDDDFRVEIEMFGNRTTRGAFIVNLVLGGCAAYRTQLFLYLKACGREELGTTNLWAGVDAPAPAAAG